MQIDARTVVVDESVSFGDVVLSIRKGEFWWSKKALTPTLEGINLVIRKGELVGVLGRVGAGKLWPSLHNAWARSIHRFLFVDESTFGHTWRYDSSQW